MVSGCPPRSLLEPILSVTVGGSNESQRLAGKGEINGAAGDRPLARHDTHTALVAFLPLSIPQLDPFISTLRQRVRLSFSVILSHCPSIFLLLPSHISDKQTGCSPVWI